MLKKIIRLLTVVLIIGVFLIPVPVSAYTDQPSPTPTFTQIGINRNLIKSNDALIYGMYDIPYSSVPSATADQTFTLSVMNSGKTTTYGSVAPYVYHNNGYGKGIVAWYFSEPSFTWSSTLYVRIGEIDSQFASPVDTDVQITSGNYSTKVTRQDNIDEVEANIQTIGGLLETEFGIDFFTTYEGNTVLTDAGQTYLMGAIHGLQSVAPGLFAIQQGIDVTTRQYTTANFDSYQNRFQGTWVGDAMDAGGDMLGMGGNTFMMFVVTLPLIIGAIIFTSLKFRKTEPGLILASLFMIMAAIMGWMPTALFATIFQLFAIYIGYLLFYARSGDALGHRLLSFSAYCYLASALICVILEGTYFGKDEAGIFNGLGLFTTYNLPIIGHVPAFNVDFLSSVGKILTWDYSFYSGSYVILRWLWFGILSPGIIWGFVQIFIGLLPTIISIFKPSLSSFLK